MTILKEGSLVFQFDDTQVAAEKYDDWEYVNKHWPERHRQPEGPKKVDFVAVGSSVTWLIEVKDFTLITHPPRRSNLSELPQTVLQKVKDTLLGLAATAQKGSGQEKSHAAAAICGVSFRVVLHLEPHPNDGPHHKLFKKEFSADVLQKLRQHIKQMAEVDPEPLVLNIKTTPRARVPWRVEHSS